MADDKGYVHTLNGLIEVCVDGQNGFLEASQGTVRPELQQLFITLSSQRQKFAEELEEMVASTGEKPKTSGSLSGTLHRGWLNIKKAVAGPNEMLLLEECERGEDIAVKAYKDALAHPLPPQVETLLSTQYAAIQTAHDRVKAVRDGLRAAVAAAR